MSATVFFFATDP